MGKFELYFIVKPMISFLISAHIIASQYRTEKIQYHIPTGPPCMANLLGYHSNFIDVKNMHPHWDSNPGPWNTVAIVT